MFEAGSAFVNLGVDLGGLTKGFALAERATTVFADGIEQKVATTERSFTKAGAAAGIFGKVLGGIGIGAAVAGMAALGTAVAGVGASSIAVASTYESTLNRFASVAGSAIADAGMSISQFNDLALEMGAKTQFSAGQAADAMVELAKGGLTPATIAAGGLEGALSLAAAGELALADAAGITAKQLGVWSDQGVTAEDVANKLAQAANASTVDVAELALGLANAGGSAKVAGLSFAEVTQTMALLAPGFSSASDAGTSFKTLLSNLAPETDRQIAAFQTLNLLTADGTSKFFDLNGQFVGMEEASRLLAEGTKNLSEEQKIMALNAAFGSDAIRAAALIAERGASGYVEMGKAMDGAGTAAQQAAERNKGLGFAIESLKGSLETIQIVVGSAVIPILTDFIEDALIPGANAVLEFAQAMTSADDPMFVLIGRIDDILPGFRGTVTVVGRLADVVGENLVPALSAAGVVMLGLGVQQTPMLITQVGLLTTRVIAGTTAITGYGVAMGVLAAGPFVVLGAAAFALTKAIQGLNKTYQEGAEKVLASRQWWTDSAAALDRYAQSGATASASVQPLAKALEDLRATQEAEIVSLAKRMAAGNVSAEQYAAEMKVINERAAAIRAATGDLNLAVQATEAATYAQEHGTVPEYITYLQQTIPQAAGEAGAALTQLSDEEVAKLEQALERASEQGTAALQSWIDTTLTFRDEFATAATDHWAAIAEIDKQLAGQLTASRRAELETQRADMMTSYTSQQQDRAAAYAVEAAAHRAHLGEMLIETVNSWTLMGQVPADRAAEMNAALATEYGVAASNSQLMFGQMIGHLTEWRDNADISSGEVIGDLQTAGETAVDTEQKMNNLTGEYTATLIQNFLEGKLDADELTDALGRVPRDVSVQIQTNAAAVAAAVDAANSALDRLAARSNQTVNIRANIPRPILAESPSPMETSLRNISEIIRTMPTLDMKATGSAVDMLIGGFVGERMYYEPQQKARLAGVAAGNAFGDGVFDSTGKKMPLVKQRLIQDLGGLAPGVPNIARQLGKNTGTELGNGVIETTGEKMKIVKQAIIQNLGDPKFLAEAGEKARLLGVETKKGIVRSLVEQAEEFKAGLINLGDPSLIDRSAEKGKEVGKAFVEGMAEGARTGRNDFIGAISGVANGVAFGSGTPSNGGAQVVVGGEGPGSGVFDSSGPVAAKSLRDSAETGRMSADRFVGTWTDTITRLQPELSRSMTDTLSTLRREAIIPWLDGINERMLLDGGWWMISLAEGISGNRSAIDAANAMGRDIAAGLLSGYGQPVLPAPVYAGTSAADNSSANPADRLSSRTVNLNLGSLTINNPRNAQDVEDGLNAMVEAMGERL